MSCIRVMLADEFVNTVIEAAKEELRKELGL
jgi:hypothetical protein